MGHRGIVVLFPAVAEDVHFPKRQDSLWGTLSDWYPNLFHRGQERSQHKFRNHIHLVKANFILEQVLKAQTGGAEVQLNSFFNLGNSWGECSTPRPGRFIPGYYPVPHVQEAGWATLPVLTGAKNLAFTGIRSPDRPARSESLTYSAFPAHISV